jgi:hypothetical protein
MDSDGAEAGFARLRKMRRYFRDTPAENRMPAAKPRLIFGGDGPGRSRTSARGFEVRRSIR